MTAAPTIPNSSTNPRARAQTNVKFANDGSLESVNDLLYKVAIKCHARVSAMGLGMDFNDVLQEMHMSYVKAKAKWRPDGGALFSTYCTTVCQRNFNHAIKKMERDRRVMGMVSYQDVVTGEDGSEVDPLEVMHSAAAPDTDSPDARLQAAQETQERLKSLSAGTRRLVALLLKNEQQHIDPPPRLRELARMANLEGPELRRAKQEILATFGVAWQ